MEIISFFESARQEHWLAEIGKSEWEAARFLYELLSGGTFGKVLGEKSMLLLLADGDKLVSFCTFSERDDIRSTELTPWTGFVYTFPEYRGHRYMGLLFGKIELLAKERNIPDIYISTDHTGLYEKYGYEFLTRLEDIHGEMSRVYVKHILPQTDRMM